MKPSQLYTSAKAFAASQFSFRTSCTKSLHFALHPPRRFSGFSRCDGDLLRWWCSVAALRKRSGGDVSGGCGLRFGGEASDHGGLRHSANSCFQGCFPLSHPGECSALRDHAVCGQAVFSRASLDLALLAQVMCSAASLALALLAQVVCSVASLDLALRDQAACGQDIALKCCKGCRYHGARGTRSAANEVCLPCLFSSYVAIGRLEPDGVEPRA